MADLLTIIKMFLDSNDTKDLSDLLSLIRKVGIPKEIEKQLLNERQRNNLKMVKLWKKMREKHINFSKEI